MNWDDPVARFNLIERVGPAEYERQHLQHCKNTTVSVVAGHSIRPVGSRFGRLFLVEGTGKAFSTLTQAEEFAAANPTC
jgi:hypothetical protein